MPRVRRLRDARLAAQLPPRGRKSAFVARRRAPPHTLNFCGPRRFLFYVLDGVESSFRTSLSVVIHAENEFLGPFGKVRCFTSPPACTIDWRSTWDDVRGGRPTCDLCDLCYC